MLAYLGAPLDGRRAARRRSTRAAGIAGSPARASRCPADPSSSAFLVAAALVAGAREVRLPGVCVNPTRTGFLDAIAAMGGDGRARGRSAHAGPEPVADARRARRGARAARRPRSPATSRCARSTSCRSSPCSRRARAGTTVVRDAEELRVKESDRIATTCAMLRGVRRRRARRTPMASPSRAGPIARSTPARVHADGDHRIAMAAAVAGLVATGTTADRRCRQRRDVVSGFRRGAHAARRDDSQRSADVVQCELDATRASSPRTRPSAARRAPSRGPSPARRCAGRSSTRPRRTPSAPTA